MCVFTSIQNTFKIVKSGKQSKVYTLRLVVVKQMMAMRSLSVLLDIPSLCLPVCLSHTHTKISESKEAQIG